MSVGILLETDDTSPDFEIAIETLRVNNRKRNTRVTLEVPIFLRRLDQAEQYMGSVPSKPDGGTLRLALWADGRHMGRDTALQQIGIAFRHGCHTPRLSFSCVSRRFGEVHFR